MRTSRPSKRAAKLAIVWLKKVVYALETRKAFRGGLLSML